MNFPKTAGQCKYMLALRSSKPITIGTGPAGSGKTMLACQVAIEYIHKYPLFYPFRAKILISNNAESDQRSKILRKHSNLKRYVFSQKQFSQQSATIGKSSQISLHVFSNTCISSLISFS